MLTKFEKLHHLALYSSVRPLTAATSSQMIITTISSTLTGKKTKKETSEPWNDDAKIQAALLLKEKIIERMQKVKELERLIERTTPSMEARLESMNQIGAIIFMKLIIKYEAQKEEALKAINELRDLAKTVRYSDNRIDYESKIRTILSAAAKEAENEDKDQMLAEINARLHAVSLKQSISRAA